MRYMLMICDESVQKSPAEMGADPEFWTWFEEMDRRGCRGESRYLARRLADTTDQV